MRRCVSSSQGRSEWGCADGWEFRDNKRTHSHKHTHTYTHRNHWLSAACFVPRLRNNLRAHAFQHNSSSLPPFKLRHDSRKIKIEPCWPLLSLPCLPRPPIFTLSTLFLPVSSLQSDVVAAVLLQLSNACALRQAEGCLGSKASRIFTLPSGKCAFHQHKTCSE